jgi:hypothetical protein
MMIAHKMAVIWKRKSFVTAGKTWLEITTETCGHTVMVISRASWWFSDVLALKVDLLSLMNENTKRDDSKLGLFS